jgi:integrase/recombinase XerC
LRLADGVRLLRPDEQVLTAMLDGWRNQQLARNLSFGTVENRQRSVRAFAEHAQALPWRWTPQLVDEWCTDLRAVRRVRRSTLRGYQEAVRLFCAYLTDPAYGWIAECEERFGTHPVQVVHEWNAAVHVAAAEGDPAKRAFTQSHPSAGSRQQFITAAASSSRLPLFFSMVGTVWRSAMAWTQCPFSSAASRPLC